MQGGSSVLPDSAVELATTATRVVFNEGSGDIEVGGHGGGGGGSNSGEDRMVIVDEADRMSCGANRWPRQETLALLKIRSDMDAVFRDSSLKGPLWEEVSRKLAELGYHRNAKKCKEKFENVYKYHKRTKDGRTGKSEGKTYRFFDQLEAFESTTQSQSPAPPPRPQPPPAVPSKPQSVTMPPHQIVSTTTTTLPWSNNPPNVTTHASTVPSATTNSHHVNIVITPNSDPTISPMPLSSSQPLNPSHNQNIIFPTTFQNLTSHLFSSSTSSSTASDEELHGSRKRKRRWKDFFERLTKDVIKKQEDLQKKFLETVEKRENERIAREDAWRVQEISRINKEHEILIQERTTAAAKDAAVIAFLQKISGQQNAVLTLDIPQPPPPPVPVPVQAPPPIITPSPPQPQPQPPVQVAQPRNPPTPAPSLPITRLDIPKKDNGMDNIDNALAPSPSRWPKVEVEALIKIRTNLDTKYQENGPKGPLWEEISAAMRRIGYNRSSKRCKEKWENINKYFKKVKESNKQRSGDSKTCPYFHQLDAIYKEKGKNYNENSNSVTPVHVSSATTMTTEPLMVRPEQQWPPLQGSLQHAEVINGRQIMNQNIQLDDEDDDDEDDEGDTEEEDEGGGCFQVVASKPPPTSLGINGD
ncbi:trihelix transcription factor DF1-like [Mercurialis annua]|uniref:trihelix transcription factor DF1-like n=1 Tax=Mercurialis annua TaxID=3986 RepID=UPI00215ED521|nr:trihelix transcription factor DF1-like [Mercurialis annua]